MLLSVEQDRSKDISSLIDQIAEMRRVRDQPGRTVPLQRIFSFLGYQSNLAVSHTYCLLTTGDASWERHHMPDEQTATNRTKPRSLQKFKVRMWSDCGNEKLVVVESFSVYEAALDAQFEHPDFEYYDTIRCEQ